MADNVVPGSGNENPASGYVGTDYADWYRHYYGSEWDGASPMAAKPDWMSMTDYNRGAAHYNYGQKTEAYKGGRDAAVGMAEGRYSHTVSAADKVRRSEQEYNGVLYERMKKYMPLQQKMAGMGNMGIAQTGLARITNDHMNRRGAIQGAFDDVVADASLARATEVGAAEQAWAENMSELESLTMKEMLSIYAQEDQAKEEEQQAAIDAFRNSITSYASAEDALAGLDALGLEATDPQYTALKTQIEGNFRDKALEGIIGNLDNYTDKDAALAALGYVLQPDNPLFAQYAMQIEGHFSNKVSDDLEQVYSDIMAILTSEGSYEEKAQAMSKYQEYISQLPVHQQDMINYLYGTDASRSMKDAVGELMDRYATDDEIEAELEKWKDAPGYQDYYDEVMKGISTEKFNYNQRLAEKGDGINYANEMKLMDDADKYANGDVDAYIQSVVAGDQSIEVTQAVTQNEPNLNPQNVTVKIDGDALEKNSEWLGPVFEYNLKKLGITNPHSNNIPNGTVVMTAKGGSIKCVVRFNNSWYLCDHFEKGQTK